MLHWYISTNCDSETGNLEPWNVNYCMPFGDGLPLSRLWIWAPHSAVISKNAVFWAIHPIHNILLVSVAKGTKQRNICFKRSTIPFFHLIAILFHFFFGYEKWHTHVQFDISNLLVLKNEKKNVYNFSHMDSLGVFLCPNDFNHVHLTELQREDENER